MKTQLFLVALLCFSAALAKPMAESEEPVTDSQAECIMGHLRQLETDLEGAGEVGSDALETVRRLMAQRETCENLLSDPPTTMEQRLHEACRLAWTANVARELNRLRGETVIVDGVITAVQECRA